VTNLVKGVVVALATCALFIPVAVGGAANSHASSRAVCPGPAALGAALCSSRVVTDSRGNPYATTSPTGYGPAQFHGAYSLPYTASGNQTIGIVDAYNDPSAKSDLDTFDSAYGLSAFPSCSSTITTSCFEKVNQSGGTSYPRTDSGWALEISLDVQVAHQMCQNCKILLVEAKTNSFANLGAAVDEAVKLGANVVSNSYGGSDTSPNSDYNHPGVAITASSGDGGYGVESPASFNTVVAVGGTTLNLGPNNSYGSETVWSGSGSGCSTYNIAQSWQTAASGWSATGCGSERGVADVAADADPNTGASVYDSTKYQGQAGWFQVGGTSLSSPLIASTYALAGNASSASYPASIPYAHTSSLHDITSGSNGTCSTTMCKGATGYDGPTGVGTPNGTGGF